MIMAIFLWTVIGCWSNVVSAVVTITRGTNDLIQFSSCPQNTRNFCNNLNADPYGKDERLCSCQCRPNFVMYADPFVNRLFKYELGKFGCIWYGNSHEGCTSFQTSNQGKIRRPIIIDLARNGHVSGLKADIDESCLGIVPYIKYPGENEWTEVNVNITLINTLNGTYKLQWKPNSRNRYAYQGLAMRLDVCGRKPKRNCMITKIGGTYTDPKKCKQRTVDGRCCVFPFLLDGMIYNNCSNDKRFDEKPWCPVSLKFNNDPLNPNFWAPCAAGSFSGSKRPKWSTAFPSRSSPGLITSSVGSRNVTTSPPSLRNSRGSTGNQILIIGIVVGFLVLLIIVVVALICFHRLMGKKKISRKANIGNHTNEGCTEARNTSCPESSPTTVPRSENHLPLESLEKDYEGPSDIKPCETRFCETRVDVTPRPTNYDVPTTAYSLIVTLPKKTKTGEGHSSSTDDPSAHVYVDVQHKSDPSKNPEPVDNEWVYVEANPLYITRSGQNRTDQNHSEMSGAIYDVPSETKPSRNTYDIPKRTVKKE